VLNERDLPRYDGELNLVEDFLPRSPARYELRTTDEDRQIILGLEKSQLMGTCMCLVEGTLCKEF
jgi:hypothetical protein